MVHNKRNDQKLTSFALVPAIISTESSRVICGTRFVLSAENGDIISRTQQGFYAHDTRFLSRFTVSINGARLRRTGYATFEDRLASFYCAVGTLSIVRDRYVSSSFHEDISVTNHGSRPADINLEIEFGADFADVFEVRRGRIHKAGAIAAGYSEEEGLTLSYYREEYSRKTRIDFSVTPEVVANVARFRFKLSPKEIWKTCIDVMPVVDHEHTAAPCISEILGTPFGPYEEKSFLGFFEEVDAGMPLEDVPAVQTDNPDLAQAYHRAIGDLKALRLMQDDGSYVLAAGLPWFMAVFGRDSILSAIQTKLLGPELMVGTLQTLARLQATEIDRFRDSEPGKIIHEIRKGELSVFDYVPHTRYYGSIDATPLFPILLREAYQWTGKEEILQKLLPYAELALEWTNKYGDIDGDGFVEYRRRISKGLLNQGWKDSHDSISFNDGTLARGPIALVEVQGYVYSAKRSMAAIYRILGNLQRADDLDREAFELRARFNDAFWMPEHGYYAIALDGKKRPVDAIASNAGHCMWCGIVSDDKAEKVAERLMAPDMFNGWGIRTLSSTARRYDPLSYHNGSIWPHDNSIIVSGLKRYGFINEVTRITQALIEASSIMPSHRLPELFAGYPRRAYSFPVPYPAANSPQAWASGSIIFLMESLLDITPGEQSLECSDYAKSNLMFKMEGVRYRDARQALP